jgi:hypothetical protein
MVSGEQKILTQFRVMKGEALFQDGEDSVHIHYLQKWTGAEWLNVFHLTMETGRSWGDEIDLLFRRLVPPQELIIHVSGFGYWGDTEYYRSLDDGATWQPTTLRRAPDAAFFQQETLSQI